MSELPWLIIPVETKARELDAKTYIACVAAEAGFCVMLGEQNAFLRRLALLPRGVYLDKSIARPKVPIFARLKKLGFRVMAWCEEGLVYRDRDAYLNERVAPAAFEEIDAFFAWGKQQAADIRSTVNDTPPRIFETGNPRFDLLRPGLREFYRAEADALRERFGDFILINTNFGRYNHYFGREKIFELLQKRGSVRTPQDEAFFRAWIEFLGQVFHSFQDMLPRLAAAFPERTIIVRPHPSENHEAWHKAVEGLANVKVIYDGGAMPWLLASALSIHNSCTTGLEGALMDKPAIAYRTVRSEIYDSYLPNRVSVDAGSFDELVAAINSVFAGSYRAPLADDEAVPADVARYIASLDGREATERIVATISALATAPPRHVSLITRIRDQGEQTLRTIARTLLSPLRRTGGYAKQKFPGLEPREIEMLVERYRALTGRFGAVKVRPSHPHAVTLQID